MKPLIFGRLAMNDVYLAGLALLVSASMGCATTAEPETDPRTTEALSGAVTNVGWELKPFKATGETVTFTAPPSTLTNDRAQYILQHPCTTATWTVPAGVYLVRIEAVGGSGAGLDGAGRGGRGAKVSGAFLVTPGETLSIMAATNGTPSWDAFGAGFPGGGLGILGGGGASYVARGAITRAADYARDPNGYTFSCSVDPAQLMLLAGGGGANGHRGGFSSGGSGGDAGLLYADGQPGTRGDGTSPGGGGGGATESRGGYVGSHSGCGTDVRWEGRFLRGGEAGGGGGGGAGYYGGGPGGADGACSPFLIGGGGGGGGGSSVILAPAFHSWSAPDAARTPYVSLTPGILGD